MRAAGAEFGKGASGEIIATIQIQCDLKITKRRDVCMHYIHMSSCSTELFSRLARAELIFARMPGPLMANGCVH